MSTEERKIVAGLLDGLSLVDLRELGISALRRWRRRFPTEVQFQTNGYFASEFLSLAAARKNKPVGDVNHLKETFRFGTEVGEYQPFLGVLEFLDWLVRAGFATPYSGEANRYPIWFRVTRSGLAFLDGADDHPLLPGAIERLVKRCPDIGENVIALLVDARTCLERALHRAAVMMTGMAYEVAIEEMLEILVKRGTVPATLLAHNAQKRIAGLTPVLEALPREDGKRGDHYVAVKAALDFADQLRRRRYDAAHPTPRYAFEHREEVEELLVSAGRHLPALWSLTAR